MIMSRSVKTPTLVLGVFLTTASLFSAVRINAQGIVCDFAPTEPALPQGGGQCWGSGSAYTGLWRLQANHVPYAPGYTGFGYGALDPDGYHRYPTADKTINVSIVVWLRDEGDLNYVDDPAGVNRARLVALFDYISANYFENVESPTDPAIAEVGYYLTNTRIKLHVDPTNIVFRNSTYWWSAAQQSCVNATVMDNTSAAVLADRPDLANTLMFHIVGPWSCPVTVIDPDTGLPTTVQSTGTASDPALNALAWYDQPWVVVRGSENPDVPPESQFGSIAYL